MRDEASVLKSLTGEPMVLLGVAAEGHLDGLLFELEVEQHYRNPRENNIETVYTFPLPFGAVLLGLEFRLGAKTLDGVVVERKQAEADYEETIEKGDTAIMLERAGDGLYTVNLGNLMAGEDAVIRYRYAQLLRFEKGRVRLGIPTVIAPRFGTPDDAGLEPHQAPTTDVLAEYPFSVSIELRGEVARGSVESPSHPIKVTATTTGVTASLAQTGFLDRDFVLVIDGLAGTSLTTIEKDGDGYVALASFCVALPRPEAVDPLSLKILVDCSGSMAGDSIGSAKRAVQRILEQLDVGDTFTLSRFGNQVQHYFAAPRFVDHKAIGEAAQHLAELEADMGGTELENALTAVFKLGGGENADVLLITDGEVWKAESLVSQAHNTGQRIFAVAVGSAPAESLHRALAEQTGGACECVAPNDDVEAAIVRMFSRMRAPRVRDLSVAWPGKPSWQTPLPSAAFDDETLHIFAGYDARPEGEVRLAFHAGDEAGNREVSIALVGQETGNDTLARIAASQRLKDLAEPEHTNLALRYQLVTANTSYLILHIRAEAEKAKSLPELQQVAQMHAAGWGGLGTVRRDKFLSGGHQASRRISLQSTFGGARVQQQASRYRTGMFSLGSANDARLVWVTPQRFLAGPRRGVRNWLLAPAYPTTLADLIGAGVPGYVIDCLKRLVHQGELEAVVLQAFIEALAESPAGAKLTRHGRRAIRALFANEHEHAALRKRLCAAFASSTPTDWPAPAAFADSGDGRANASTAAESDWVRLT